MIAKLIVTAGDREECIIRSERALEEFDIDGFHTIIPFHRLMLDDDTFRAGTHTTKYLDQELADDALDAVLHDGRLTRSVATLSTASTISSLIEVDGSSSMSSYGRTAPHLP